MLTRRICLPIKSFFSKKKCDACHIYVVLTDDIDKWIITNNQREMHTSNKYMAQFSLEWKG